MTPLLDFPPIGHSYFIVVVDDVVVGVVLVGAGVGVVVGVVTGGGVVKQASDTKTTREITRTEHKKFIFVSELVTRLED